MDLTDYHAKYFAHELTKRSASDSVGKLAGVLADAQVDLNPHQVEAALFARRRASSVCTSQTMKGLAMKTESTITTEMLEWQGITLSVSCEWD
ncbi:MAG: hypothetical protein JSR60_18640 [Proteobacteria bacterium]|nr:hypothetical protein [Pseudomonadota bacterium]